MNKVLLHTLSALTFVIAPAIARARSAQSYPSPDGALRAQISDISRRCAESRVEVRRAGGALLLLKKYASPDCEHGMGVYRGEWTPDSKYFVFNAQMLGGHQPWHWPVYFYDRGENRIWRLDGYVGPVVTPEFKIEAPHSVETRVLETGNDEGRRVIVDLRRIGRRRHHRPEPNNGTAADPAPLTPLQRSRLAVWLERSRSKTARMTFSGTTNYEKGFTNEKCRIAFSTASYCRGCRSASVPDRQKAKRLLQADRPLRMKSTRRQAHTVT